MSDAKKVLKEKLTTENYDKLIALNNAKMLEFVADAIKLANPKSVFVCTDSKADIDYIRELTVKIGEEQKLSITGHTYHLGSEDFHLLQKF